MPITATQLTAQTRADIGAMISVVGNATEVYRRLSKESGVSARMIRAFYDGARKTLGVENLDAVVTALQRCRGWTDE